MTRPPNGGIQHITNLRNDPTQPTGESMNRTTAPPEDEVEAPSAVRRHGGRSIEPFDLLLIVATFGAAVTAIGPIWDTNDVFWHVLLGDQMRSGVPFSDLGSTFSFGLENADWRTGAWGSEVIQSWLYDVGGWVLLVNTLRLATVAAVAVILWRSVVVRLPSRAVALPYFLAMAALALTVQERPQSFSFIFLTVTGVWWFRIAVEGHVPRWFVVGIVSFVWANLHGLWIVLPAVLLIALVGRMLDVGLRDPLRNRILVTIAAAVVGGLLTPLGIKGPLLSLQIRDAASSVISEWQVTGLYDTPGVLLLVAGGLSLFLAARLRSSRAEVLFIVAVSIFGLMAVRNVVPAVLLLTPLLASLIARALGARAEVTASDTERRRLRLVAWGLTAVGLVAVAATIGVRDQGPPKDLPIPLVSQLADEPGPVRLFNEYNLSGVALFYGGPDVKLAVDGRTDFYGREYLDRYMETVLYGKDLDEVLAELRPTHALLETDSGAAALLRTQGWVELGAEYDYVLLVAP
jgi:hypothetical protein